MFCESFTGLYFAECATDFTMSYGDIDKDFYEVFGYAYHVAIAAVVDL